MSSSSPLVACTDYFPVQKPVKTSSMLSILTPKIFSSTEPSIPFGCVNNNVCCGELGSMSLQSSSSKHKAMYFVLTKLVLDRVAELTPRNKKLYNMIWTREGALCKMRKTYRAKKQKEVCQLDSNRLIQSLSSSLSVDTSRFLASIDRYIDLYPTNAPDPFKSASYERNKRLRCGHLIVPHSHVQA